MVFREHLQERIEITLNEKKIGFEVIGRLSSALRAARLWIGV